MKAFRVWGVMGDGVDFIASTAYEKPERAQAICDRQNGLENGKLRFEVRPEEVPGELKASDGTRLFRTVIVVKGDDNHHTRFS